MSARRVGDDGTIGVAIRLSLDVSRWVRTWEGAGTNASAEAAK